MIVKTSVKQADYKPVVAISENRRHVYFGRKDSEDGVTCLCKVFDIAGNSKDVLLSKIKEYILGYYNAEIDAKIHGGFVWTDPDGKQHSVWLSTENQFNYKAAYDAYKAGGMPADGFTAKFGDTYEGDFYTFTDITALADFYLKGLQFVQSTLAAGWAAKNAIDWAEYEEAL